MVPLVPGRSYLLLLLLAGVSGLHRRKALKIGGLGAKSEPPAPPNAVEFRLTNLARVLGGGFGVKTEGYSDIKLSYGKVSTAYWGGPMGTPHRLWWGAANCSNEINLRRCCFGSGCGSVSD